MKEQNKDNKGKEEIKSPGFGDVFGGDDSASESKEATVGSGVYLEKLPVAGMTVAAIRDKYSDRMDIADNAAAFIDGKAAEAEQVVLANQVLRFAHKAGEKGR